MTREERDANHKRLSKHYDRRMLAAQTAEHVSWCQTVVHDRDEHWGHEIARESALEMFDTLELWLTLPSAWRRTAIDLNEDDPYPSILIASARSAAIPAGEPAARALIVLAYFYPEALRTAPTPLRSLAIPMILTDPCARPEVIARALEAAATLPITLPTCRDRKVP